MGDAAEYYDEQGIDAWASHLAGRCQDDYCQYCYEAEYKKERKSAKAPVRKPQGKVKRQTTAEG